MQIKSTILRKSKKKKKEKRKKKKRTRTRRTKIKETKRSINPKRRKIVKKIEHACTLRGLEKQRF